LWLLVRMKPAAVAWIALSADARPMAENLYRFVWSWLVCVIVTVAVSLVTKPKPAEELEGLVYGLTRLPVSQPVSLVRRPLFLTSVIAGVFLLLNLYFW